MVVLFAVAFIVLFFIFVVAKVVSTQRKKALTGAKGLVGEEGEVRERLAPEGIVLVHGELWRAKEKEGKTVKKGERIKISKVEGMLLTVEKVEEKA